MQVIEEIRKSQAKKQVLESRLEQEKQLVQECEDNLQYLKETEQFSQEIASRIQNEAHKQISEIVSKCLSDVFEEEAYEFSIQFEEKRGKTEAKFVLRRNGEEIGTPMDSSGGGVLDVAAFALRVASIVLSKSTPRKMLLLDEPFRFVSQKYRDKIVSLLNEMSQKFDMQIIMVTHIEELKTGNIIQL